MALLKKLKAEGHRTLVFSQSRVMLDTLQKACKRDKLRCVRIDGSVVSAAKRSAIVQRFQTDESLSVFLLSSQVGLVALTLRICLALKPQSLCMFRPVLWVWLRHELLPVAVSGTDACVRPANPSCVLWCCRWEGWG
jgi:Helicase conserved C-terminal domain